MWVERQGGGAHDGQKSPWRGPACHSIKGHDSWGLVGITQASHGAMIISQCPFQELGYRIHVSAAILVSVYAERVLREQLETSLLFLPFWSQLISNPNFFNLFHPSSEASSLLLESSFSKSETVPCHSGDCFLWPWV